MVSIVTWVKSVKCMVTLMTCMTWMEFTFEGIIHHCV